MCQLDRNLDLRVQLARSPESALSLDASELAVQSDFERGGGCHHLVASNAHTLKVAHEKGSQARSGGAVCALLLVSPHGGRRVADSRSILNDAIPSVVCLSVARAIEFAGAGNAVDITCKSIACIRRADVGVPSADEVAQGSQAA